MAHGVLRAGEIVAPVNAAAELVVLMRMRPAPPPPPPAPTEMEELEREAANVSELATGTLRIDAPVVYGRRILLPVLARLASSNPGLEIDLRPSDVYADVVTSGLDAVVRVGEVADSHLVAHVFDIDHLGIYGSPAYFARKGRAKEPADLERHDCVRFRRPGTGRHRPWYFRKGEKDVAMNPVTRYSLNDGDGVVAAAVLGLGLMQGLTTSWRRRS